MSTSPGSANPGTPPSQLASTAPTKRKLWPWILAALILFVAAAGGAVYVLRPDPMQAGYDACATAAEGRLKAPSTAEFGGWTWHPDLTPPEVRGWVDADNSFGARIRNNIECSVERSGEDWKVLNVTVAPR